MRKAIRIINTEEIKCHYNMPMAIDAMVRAFTSLSSGESFVPMRYITKLPSNEMMMLFKPAYVEKERQLAVKILTQREKGMQGIPTIQGIILLIDAVSGEILSMMDGEYLTALRTGAASGLATRCFARKDSRVLALFGCGTQGRTQVEAVLCEREIKKVLLFDKNRPAADSLGKDLREKYQIEASYYDDISELKDCDIICTATNASSPLFCKEDVKQGVHINAIGSFQPDMQELDPYLIKDAALFVDQAETCLKESGDLIKAINEGIIDNDQITGEIGDYCLNKIKGRESEDDITVFKSVGVAIQDFTVASDIYNLALKEGFGQSIHLVS